MEEGPRARMMLTLGTSLAYMLSSSVLFPNGHPILTPCPRLMIVIWVTHFDAMFAYDPLRARGEKLAGRLGPGKGFFSVSTCFVLVGILLNDALRPYLMLFVAGEASILELAAMRNPLNGNELSLTNHMIAGATFLTFRSCLYYDRACKYCQVPFRFYIYSTIIYDDDIGAPVFPLMKRQMMAPLFHSSPREGHYSHVGVRKIMSGGYI